MGLLLASSWGAPDPETSASSRGGLLEGEIQSFEVNDFYPRCTVLVYESGFDGGLGCVEVAAGEGVGCGLREDERGEFLYPASLPAFTGFRSDGGLPV